MSKLCKKSKFPYKKTRLCSLYKHRNFGTFHFLSFCVSRFGTEFHVIDGKWFVARVTAMPIFNFMEISSLFLQKSNHFPHFMAVDGYFSPQTGYFSEYIGTTTLLTISEMITFKSNRWKVIGMTGVEIKAKSLIIWRYLWRARRPISWKKVWCTCHRMRRMLQEVEQYQDPESWIYLQAQRVVTEVQRQVLSDITIGRNEMIEQACRAAGWEPQLGCWG